MCDVSRTRRDLLRSAATSVVIAGAASAQQHPATQSASSPASPEPIRGSQRLPLSRLREWEALGYGMFIHFGMSTFTGNPMDDGKSPASTYHPDKLDVDQWVSVARDAGMKYAVLTAKHHAGHCLWPSRHTTYSVENSGEATDVVSRFVESCRKRGVLPGLYYASLDHHHRFGSVSPQDDALGAVGEFDFRQIEKRSVEAPDLPQPAFVSSTYQDFQTAQIEELLLRYGPIMEVWIDIPNVLGRGYRRFLYERIAELHPNAVVMMNGGIQNGSEYDVPYSWPADLIALEGTLPPETGHQKWREIEGRSVYLPGEMCQSIGESWFYGEQDSPRSDADLLNEWHACQQRGVNYLLNVPPDKHGLITDVQIGALQRLRRAARI